MLLQVLSEREPELGDHIDGVAELARGRRRAGSSMTDDQIDQLVRAAELHDIGKIAIPDAILAQARRARRRRVGVHPPAHDHRRAHHRRRPGAGAGRPARALEPRALGRRAATPTGWPASAIPLGLADRRRLRRLRRDGLQAPVPRGMRTSAAAVVRAARAAPAPSSTPAWSRPSRLSCAIAWTPACPAQASRPPSRSRYGLTAPPPPCGIGACPPPTTTSSWAPGPPDACSPHA